MPKVTKYIPINRRTKQRYDPVTVEVRNKMQAEAATRNKFDFEETVVTEDDPAERPAGIKPAAKPAEPPAKSEP